jgi:hypothetical protein
MWHEAAYSVVQLRPGGSLPIELTSTLSKPLAADEPGAIQAYRQPGAIQAYRLQCPLERSIPGSETTTVLTSSHRTW